jgi:hypothetical protein
MSATWVTHQGTWLGLRASQHVRVPDGAQPVKMVGISVPLSGPRRVWTEDDLVGALIDAGDLGLVRIDTPCLLHHLGIMQLLTKLPGLHEHLIHCAAGISR